MAKYFITGFAILLLIACGKVNNEDDFVIDESSQDGNFEMYQMSEMAALMEQMYIDNERLKARIINGDTIGQFPNHFLRIHEAKMTDKQDFDQFFKDQAQIFIHSQEMIYKDPANAKEHFNNGVSACVACHVEKCGGPIPRIKKLYIQ